MVKCAKCSKVVTKKTTGLQCGKCNKWWHTSCALLTAEQLSTLNAVESADWKCKPCSSQNKQKRISVILPEDEEDNTDSEAVGQATPGSMMQEIRRQIRETIQEEMKRSLQFFSDKFDEFQDIINSYEESIKTMNRQYKDLNNKYTHIKNKSDFLEQKINMLEQKVINNQLEVCGITRQENENLMEITQKICNRLGTETNTVTKVYRKLSKSTEGQKRNAGTLVMILKDDQRDLWLESAKAITITEKDIGRQGNSRIYLREALTPATAHLLWRAKTELKTTNLVKFVWCKNGNVLIRKDEADKIIVIRSEEDIMKWAQELSGDKPTQFLRLQTRIETESDIS